MIAIIPGSFDPITNGHVDIIRRASLLFEKVIVVVAKNIKKNTLFSAQERYFLVKATLKELSNVEVVLIQSDLTVRVAERLNADVVIRGVRNSQDYVYEKQIATINKSLKPDLETLILFSNPKFSEISSSMVREINYFGGDVHKLVSPIVNEALKKKYLVKRDIVRMEKQA